MEETLRIVRRYGCLVVPEASRCLSITLPSGQAAKLARLAERTHVQEATLAASLLVHAIDDAEAETQHVIDVLDGIPGAWDRIERGLEDARSGRTIPSEELQHRLKRSAEAPRPRNADAGFRAQ